MSRLPAAAAALLFMSACLHRPPDPAPANTGWDLSVRRPTPPASTRSALHHDLLRRGKLELGASAGISYWASRSTSDNGDLFRVSRAYVNPNVVFGGMLSDRVQLRLAVGYQYTNARFREEFTDYNHAATESLQVLWYAPMPLHMAFFVGGGLGGFQGGSYRPAGVDDLYQWIPTVGIVGQGYLGLLAQPGSGIVLRGNLRAELGAGWDDYRNAATRARSLSGQVVLELGVSVAFN